MATRTIRILLGVAALVGTGCAAELGDGEKAVGEAADRRPFADPTGLSVPPVARAYEVARAIDRDLGLDSSAANAPAAAIAEPGEVITVTGRVLQLSGARVGVLKVFILGQGAATLTDANGNFTIPNVRVPYDVVIASPSGTTSHTVLYQGLLRPDPRLVAFTEARFLATITGAVSGGAGYPEPAGHFSFVQIGTDRGGMGFGQVNRTTGAYGASAEWGFAPSTTAHLTALQFVAGGGRVQSFTGAATAQFPIRDGQAVVRPVPLLPVETTTIAGAYTYPPGYSFLGVVPAVESVNFSFLPLPVDPVDRGTFSVAAPIIAGRSTFVAVEAFSPSGGLSEIARRGIAPGSKDLAIHLPEAPDIIAPPDGATDVDHDTVFLATDFPAGVCLFQFTGSATDPSFTVVSSDPVARIPDLSEIGVSLPRAAHYSVELQGLGPFADVDDFAGPTGPLPSPELIIVAAPFVRFTTAP
ncbi:MAG TPA: hypothetical protein VJU16_06300 [Planctomycetota bacterium]|nr:hypothetical protein [Planctomycetota bacterium]